MATSFFYSRPLCADWGQLRPSRLEGAPSACSHLCTSGEPMPKFVIEREIPGAGNLTDAQLREVSQKSVNVLKGMGPEIQWLHSYVTGDKVSAVYLVPAEPALPERPRRRGPPPT